MSPPLRDCPARVAGTGSSLVPDAAFHKPPGVVRFERLTLANSYECADEKGVTSFQLLRHRRNESQAFLYAFDLLELNGTDLRREPIEVRKATLASILRKSRPGMHLNEHLEHPEGAVVFLHACKMGLEGIVSKRLGSHYRSGRSPDWLKFKNPEAPAVKREAEEDWGS